MKDLLNRSGSASHSAGAFSPAAAAAPHGRSNSAPGTPSGARQRLPRLRYAHKRLLAAAGLGTATMLAVWFALPGEETTVPVVVAGTTIAAGAEVTPAQLKVARYPPHLVPDSAVADPGELLGATTVTQIAPGTPVTETLTLGSAAAISPGYVQVAVTFADQTSAGILRPGHRIRVYSTIDEESTQALTDATVAATTEAQDSLTGRASVTTLTVPESAAARVAKAAPGGLTFALVSDQN